MRRDRTPHHQGLPPVIYGLCGTPAPPRTLLDEHFRVMGRTRFYESVDEMQTDLDAYLVTYNTKRPHQGRNMNGRTPATVFVAGLPKPKTATSKSKEEKSEKAA